MAETGHAAVIDRGTCVFTDKCYAISGSDTGIVLRECYEMSGTEKGHVVQVKNAQAAGAGA
eukprot:2033639-Rhodomonas_salina.5